MITAVGAIFLRLSNELQVQLGSSTVDGKFIIPHDLKHMTELALSLIGSSRVAQPGYCPVQVYPPQPGSLQGKLSDLMENLVKEDKRVYGAGPALFGSKA
jgi:hypothetical protein